MGVFAKGTEPTQLCSTHTKVEYDAVCGGVATVFTPENHVIEVGMIKVERAFPIQILVSDAQYVYKKLEGDVFPSLEATKPFFASLEDEKKKKYFGVSAGKVQFNRLSTSHMSASDIYFAFDLLQNQH